MADFLATEFGATTLLTTNADATEFGDDAEVLGARGYTAKRIPDALLPAGGGAPCVGGGPETDAGSWSWLS
jgi:hypothetical protein